MKNRAKTQRNNKFQRRIQKIHLTDSSLRAILFLQTGGRNGGRVPVHPENHETKNRRGEINSFILRFISSFWEPPWNLCTIFHFFQWFRA